MNLDPPQPAAPSGPAVAASILSADFARMAEECRDVLEGGADLLHLDVMDGHFVPNLTMGADMCRALRAHFPAAFLDVHLMVERPRDYLAMFADAGADRFTFHVEVCSPRRSREEGGEEADGLIAGIHAAGMEAGLAVNPPTPGQAIEPWIADVDLVLVMSVNPGRSGQKFMPEVLTKARWTKPRQSPSQRLQIDGGISPSTAPQAVAAGVDVLVTASALFGARDRASVINQLHRVEQV